MTVATNVGTQVQSVYSLNVIHTVQPCLTQHGVRHIHESCQAQANRQIGSKQGEQGMLSIVCSEQDVRIPRYIYVHTH